MATIKLANGMEITGTPEQIARTLKALEIPGDGIFYNSDSRGGLVLIAEMNTTHLRNAILKMYDRWVDSLHRIEDPAEFVRAVVEGNTDPTFRAMLIEISKREE